MMLLSRINGYNLEDLTLEAEYDITRDCLFYKAAMDAVPAWAGFEFLAQAISAFSGIRNRENGIPPKMGYIMSVSSMRIDIPFFREGTTVTIRTREIDRINLVYTFEGEIIINGEKVLEGKLTVIEVDEGSNTNE